jgi:hypothetical protein
MLHIVLWYSKSYMRCLRQEPGGQPGPSSELDFWTRKAAALGSLHEQLRSEQLQQALRTLEAARSTFLPAFTRYHRQAISLTWP